MSVPNLKQFVHKISGSIAAVLAALTRSSDSGHADDSASWRNGPSSG